jgi:hypothetical protein
MQRQDPRPSNAREETRRTRMISSSIHEMLESDDRLTLYNRDNNNNDISSFEWLWWGTYEGSTIHEYVSQDSFYGTVLAV